MRTGFAALSEEKFYRDYLHRLDAQAVLDHYGAENCREQPNSRDGTPEIIHSCLLDSVERHHSNGDQNPSASCNLENKKYVCWTYWGGDLFHLIMKMEGRDELHDIVPVLSGLLTDSLVEEESFVSKLGELFARETIYSVDLPAYDQRVLRPWAFSHPYLREVRGVSLEASSRLGIGWNEDTNRIIFPHLWMGELVGWQGRAIPQDSRGEWPGTEPPIPKYKNTTGFPKSDTLYGYDLVKASGFSSIVVVESPMSVAKAHSLGIENVIATFGAKISKVQIDLMKDFRHVDVWMDNDSKSPAGKFAERRLVKALAPFTEVGVIPTELDKDLADYNTANDVYAMLDSREHAFVKLAEYERDK